MICHTHLDRPRSKGEIVYNCNTAFNSGNVFFCFCFCSAYRNIHTDFCDKIGHQTIGIGKARFGSDKLEKEQKSGHQKPLIHYDYLYLENGK